MLNIYVMPLEKVFERIKNGDEDLVLNNDVWFNLNCKNGIDFNSSISKEVLERIDHAQYVGNGFCINKKGVQFMVNDLSTGCKTVLNVLNFTKKIFVVSCGANARDCIFEYICGNILITEPFAISPKVNLSEILVHDSITGKKFKVRTYSELVKIINRNLGF